jgi:hypothetical protein
MVRIELVDDDILFEPIIHYLNALIEQCSIPKYEDLDNDKVNEYISTYPKEFDVVAIPEDLEEAVTHYIKGVVDRQYSQFATLPLQTIRNLKGWLVDIMIGYVLTYLEDWEQALVSDEDYITKYYSDVWKLLCKMKASQESLTELEQYLRTHMEDEWEKVDSLWIAFKQNELSITEFFVPLLNIPGEWMFTEAVVLYRTVHSDKFHTRHIQAVAQFIKLDDAEQQEVHALLKRKKLEFENLYNLYNDEHKILLEVVLIYKPYKRVWYKYYSVYKNPVIKKILSIIESNFPGYSEEFELAGYNHHDGKRRDDAIPSPNYLFDSTLTMALSVPDGEFSEALKINYEYNAPITLEELNIMPLEEDIITLNKCKYRTDRLREVLKALGYPHQTIYVEIPKVVASLIIRSDQGIEFILSPSSFLETDD